MKTKIIIKVVYGLVIIYFIAGIFILTRPCSLRPLSSHKCWCEGYKDGYGSYPTQIDMLRSHDYCYAWHIGKKQQVAVNTYNRDTMAKLYDVHVMRSDKLRKLVYWEATLHYQLPFALARFKVRILQGDKTLPVGAFGIALPNGVNPISYLLKKKLKT